MGVRRRQAEGRAARGVGSGAALARPTHLWSSLHTGVYAADFFCADGAATASTGACEVRLELERTTAPRAKSALATSGWATAPAAGLCDDAARDSAPWLATATCEVLTPCLLSERRLCCRTAMGL